MAETATAKGANPAPGYVENPSHMVAFEPSPRRVRISFGGETIADSTRAMLVRETGHTPVYYLPMADVRMDLMASTDRHTHCPYKGDASYWTLSAGGRTAENAVWSYRAPFDEFAPLADYVAFYWGKMDHWYEEDEEIFVHPRDPYKRVDALRSSRKVEIVLGGETVAASTRGVFLFETGLPTRYYIPAEDARADILTPSASTTACPYKGQARYWSATIGDRSWEDIVWSYPDPLPAVAGIKDLLCFYNERVDETRVDGRVVPKVKTKWSRD